MFGPVTMRMPRSSTSMSRSLGTNAPAGSAVSPTGWRPAFLHLRGDEALRVGQGLLADVVGRDQLEVGLADLDVVAEDFVEAHPQGFDPGARSFRRFEVGDPAFPLARRPPA